MKAPGFARVSPPVPEAGRGRCSPCCSVPPPPHWRGAPSPVESSSHHAGACRQAPPAPMATWPLCGRQAVCSLRECWPFRARSVLHGARALRRASGPGLVQVSVPPQRRALPRPVRCRGASGTRSPVRGPAQHIGIGSLCRLLSQGPLPPAGRACGHAITRQPTHAPAEHSGRCPAQLATHIPGPRPGPRAPESCVPVSLNGGFSAGRLRNLGTRGSGVQIVGHLWGETPPLGSW